MSDEFRPGFYAWLFSVFLAAGFGSLFSDGIRYLVVENAKDEATLVRRDTMCIDDTLQGQAVYLCIFYLENIGDKATYITDLALSDKQYEMFLTNYPIEVLVTEEGKKLKKAPVAVSKPGSMLAIGISIQKGEEDNKLCIYNGNEKVNCV